MDTVEVSQTPGCSVQLPPYFSDGNYGNGGGVVTYQLEPVGGILSNVLHNIPVWHPL